MTSGFDTPSPTNAAPPAALRPWPARARRWMFRWSLRALLGVALIVAAVAAYFWWTRPVPTPPTEIYRGVTYECRRLPRTSDAHGLVHLVTVDLAAPGIEIYVTPTDPAATAAGWEYVTRWAPSVAREEHTAVLINACLFRARTASRFSGDYAHTIETMVADHQVNHYWEHCYPLWFEDDGTPHMELSKPPRPEVLEQARWAVGGQIILSANGHYNCPQVAADRHTLVGLDPETRRLFVGVFDYATFRVAAETLVGMGATRVMPLDGGTSTTLVLGEDARGVPPGTKVYPWRALPAFFGIRADKLPG